MRLVPTSLFSTRVVFVLLHMFERGCSVNLCEICDDRTEGAKQLPYNRGNGVRDPGAKSRVFWVQSPTGEDKVGLKSHHARGEGQGEESTRDLSHGLLFINAVKKYFPLNNFFFFHICHIHTIQ